MPDTLQPQLIAAVAERLAAHEFKGWFYGDSVGFEGLVAAADLLEDPKWIDFSHGFFRAWATRRHPFHPDDNTAPGHVMCDIVERTGDEVLKTAVLDLAEHLRSRRKIGDVAVTFEDTLRSLRQPYGGVQLSKEQSELMKDPGAGIWLDCMHFDAPFYAHLSKIDPANDWAETGVREILGYREFLFDQETGTYRHYWLEKLGRSQIPGWGRGQGWALLGMLDVLKFCGDAPAADELQEQAIALAETMVSYQLEDGNWHCMVHEPRSGPESSTAAFMATAFYRGMKHGVLSKRFELPAEKAFRAMVSNLDEKGNLLGVSAAVMSALVDEHYWHVPLDRIVPWGQGPVLTAAAARSAFLGKAIS
ncbi:MULTISPECIES: glycoside hydrolase family 88 protein [Halocynthiibacter]|uniref:Glycoside hydrolase family 88 protein n=1 Tax=Halocynthiibacter halioticoli TaxID=2986804 RepID=A0AAE3IY14_9RHOB|nr:MULTISPECIES: glycoside hydrolase family 88 protein [Halocynthiibacter]MCV6822983.1 glycoside hydrolase family 88 protein [Halocynthiibacter halioticoli]MCW4055984.1 glycoside hydrolase family 88 protein [Halocynthiibacter sp. SDUM655004]